MIVPLQKRSGASKKDAASMLFDFPCFLRSSIVSLLEDKYAYSIPVTIAIINKQMIIKDIVMLILYLASGYTQI